MRRITLTTVLGCLACVFESAGAAATDMAKSDFTKSPIVVSADATKTTTEAAKELADYMEKITGTRPQVLTGDPDPSPASAIWVGVQPRVKKLFPDVSFDFKKPEEILIACKGQHVVIAGRERSVGQTQIEYGTANAIYTFLQKYLDVRWLWPGPLGEDIVKSDAIKLSPFTYSYAPQFRVRNIIMHWVWRWFRDDPPRANQIESWVRRQRLLHDSLQMDAGHAFTDWWDKFHKDHPEYFALQPDGTRSGYPGPDTVKLCQSNPAVWKQWLDNVTESLQKNPSLQTFNVSPNDWAYSGVCVCEKCRAWDSPDGPACTYYYEDKDLKYVAMTHRYITFWNHLGQLLKQRFPDRDLFVAGSAYGAATSPPTKAKIDDNVIIKYVGIFPLIDEKERTRQKADFEAWAKQARNIIYIGNLWYFGGGGWGFPEVAMTKTIEDWRFLADNRCVGIAVDMNRCYWGVHGPQYYIMAQLTWDPRHDGKALLKDYYRRGFGPAADEIERYWTLMEEARDALVASEDFEPRSAGRHRLPGIFEKVYSDDFLKRAEALLTQAAAKATEGAEVYAERVAFVRSGFDVMSLLTQNIPIMTRVRESEGKDAEAVKQAAENWQAIERICREANPFSVRLNQGGIRTWMIENGYMGQMQDYFGPPSEKFRKAAGLD